MVSMKRRSILLLSLLAFAATTHADEPKPPAKKSEKKTEKKPKQNAAQKAESSVGKWMNDNKIWTTHPEKSAKK